MIAIGSDHGGYALKEEIKKLLRSFNGKICYVPFKQMKIALKSVKKIIVWTYDYFNVFNFFDKLDFFLDAVLALITPFVQS